MEISIKLDMLSEIVFHDKTLIKDLIDSLIQDMEEQFDQLKATSEYPFKTIHYLKSSFAMVGCVEGIKSCEKLIQTKDPMDFQSLVLIFEQLKEKLLNPESCIQ
jgi:Zn-dependent M16 (insulinase) family peptidase